MSEEKATEVKTEIAPMAIGENLQIQPQNTAELMRTVKQLMKGDGFPRHLDTAEKVIAAWNLAASLKLPPQVAIRNIAVINGTPCIWGDLPKALAENTGELEQFRLICIDKDYQEICLQNKNLDAEPFGAVCKIKRKGRTENEYSYTVTEARNARLLGNPKREVWSLYTKVMLMRKAMGMAVRIEFPDALMGCAVAEYDLDQAPDLKDVTPPTEDKAALVNARFAQVPQ